MPRVAAKKRRPLHPAEQYCADVVAGRVVAGPWVRLACKRHIHDLAHAPERGLYFDPAAGQRPIDFARFCPHIEGKWAGTPITLEPWQQFILWVLFGWKRADGSRRFRTAYIEIAKKNGKSTLAAVIELFLLFADGEPGARIYSAAVDKDQAKIVWETAKEMVERGPLRKRIQTSKKSIYVSATASNLIPLSKDTKNKQGINVHGAIIDELHEHPSRAMVDLLLASRGARSQPLIFEITNAGYDRHSICWEEHSHGVNVLDPNLPSYTDDSFFAYICALDEGDKWEDETVWIKANPNLGISPRIDDLREEAELAKKQPAKLNSFLRLKLCVWTTSDVKAVTNEQWAACFADFTPDELIGHPCIGAVDLATTQDIVAAALAFPPYGDRKDYRLLVFCWIPEDNIEERVSKGRVPYDLWVKDKWIETTRSNEADYDLIEKRLIEVSHKFAVKKWIFDPFNSTQVMHHLQDEGLICEKLPQSFAGLSGPTKDFLKLIISKESPRLTHDGNPVLAWTVGNLQLETNARGDVKPSKARSREKIDPAVAVIMALGFVHEAKPEFDSIYERRGLLTV